MASYVREREKGTEKPEDWDAATESATDYFNSLERYFEDSDGNTFTFYMPESRRLPRQLITSTSDEYDPDRLGYNLRENRRKSKTLPARVPICRMVLMSMRRNMRLTWNFPDI